jgi:hypothetical protein
MKKNIIQERNRNVKDKKSRMKRNRKGKKKK